MSKKDILQKFIDDNRSAYELAAQDLLPRPDEPNGIVDARYTIIINSNGKQEGYFYRLNGKDCFSATADILKSDLLAQGYEVKSAGYQYYTFENPQISSTYKKIAAEREEFNEKILAARHKIKDAAKEYLFSNYKKIYIRFGEIPESGKSYNFRDKFFEDGVSVYAAVKVGKNYYIDVVGSIFTFGGLCKKNAYEVSGDVLDSCGSDGEPLLANVSIVKKINNDNIDTTSAFIAECFEVK